MADATSVSSNLESISTMISQLQEAFGALESHRESTAKSVISWKEIEEHFLNLGSSCKKRYDELVEKEKALKEKESQTRKMLVQREAEVANKEQALLDLLQELKDASVAAIVEARMKFKVPSPEPTDIENTEKKVTNPSNSEPICAIDGKSPDKVGQHPEAVPTEVKPRPELILLCEHMNPKGLLKFISENRKDLFTIREEMPLALKSAPEPARLVLESLDGFFPSDLTDDTHQGNKGNPGLVGFRRSCVFLMDCVAPLLLVDMEVETPAVDADVKQQAKTIADEWKPKLAVEVGVDGISSRSLEAQAFLQLLAIFGISSEFDEDELCKLVLAISHRKQTTDLCRYLGLTHKIPGWYLLLMGPCRPSPSVCNASFPVIVENIDEGKLAQLINTGGNRHLLSDIVEALVKYGRQVEAVHFIQAFHLADKYPPVPLLKEYLKELRRNSQGNGANSGNSGTQSDANAQELGALKAIIRCIEEYKLESEYALDPLQKRVAQLERAKADRKRMGSQPAKNQPMKRGRGRGGLGRGRQQPPPPVYGGRGGGYRGPGRYPYSGSPYDYAPMVPSVPPSQSMYQTGPAHSYYYQEERPPAPAPYGAPPSYGGYAGSGGYPSHQPYT